MTDLTNKIFNKIDELYSKTECNPQPQCIKDGFCNVVIGVLTDIDYSYSFINVSIVPDDIGRQVVTAIAPNGKKVEMPMQDSFSPYFPDSINVELMIYVIPLRSFINDVISQFWLYCRLTVALDLIKELKP